MPHDCLQGGPGRDRTSEGDAQRLFELVGTVHNLVEGVLQDVIPPHLNAQKCSHAGVHPRHHSLHSMPTAERQMPVAQH